MLHSTSQIYLVLQHGGIIDSFVPRFLQRIFPFIYVSFCCYALANSNCVVQLKNPVLMLSNLHSEWEEINTFICQ